MSLTPEQKEEELKMKLDKQLKKEKKEKRRRLKELGKPKKPTSGFLSYLQIQLSNQTVKDYKAAAKEYGAKWNNMTDVEKQSYRKKFEEDMVKYEQSLKNWETLMIKQVREYNLASHDIFHFALIIQSMSNAG